MMTITKQYHFHAAHRNELLVGEACANIHGHTYHVEVVIVQKPPDPVTGVTMLFADIDGFVRQVIDPLDHAFIIHTKDPLLPILKEHGQKLYELDVPTSAENLVKHIYQQLRYGVGLLVMRVSLKETTSSTVTYVEG